MNRRSLLALLGGAPLAAFVPKIAEAAIEAVDTPKKVDLIVSGSIQADRLVANRITGSKIQVGSCVVNVGEHQPDGSVVWKLKDLVSGKFVK